MSIKYLLTFSTFSGTIFFFFLCVCVVMTKIFFFFPYDRHFYQSTAEASVDFFHISLHFCSWVLHLKHRSKGIKGSN